ncbi:hypothetical protein CYV19_12235 [Natronobacterium gregoryi SP2]|uniref:Uncharacterized protein n=1 Tax=Natronobacterium gregoryi (strain ATCC 43098 / DSM 3393 / CCM 3738 / CIP 104747 / IAM 13177 / JCM 8860 / NBRC 102187 / NCIMB 2189 / SP2) TaxID=797304 RepID=A0A2J4JDH8_NATGS|nr:hypothetical protein CYV19_12235 [Natronobacterium gregoryi SP2]
MDQVMNYGTSVGRTPHARQEASPTNRSDARCSCGARADGYDVQRDEPVCTGCAIDDHVVTRDGEEVA